MMDISSLKVSTYTIFSVRRPVLISYIRIIGTTIIPNHWYVLLLTCAEVFEFTSSVRRAMNRQVIACVS